jgi:hypothetical protein
MGRGGGGHSVLHIIHGIVFGLVNDLVSVEVPSNLPNKNSTSIVHILILNFKSDLNIISFASYKR